MFLDIVTQLHLGNGLAKKYKTKNGKQLYVEMTYFGFCKRALVNHN